jgi:hypothetical protein
VCSTLWRVSGAGNRWRRASRSQDLEEGKCFWKGLYFSLPLWA